MAEAWLPRRNFLLVLGYLARAVFQSHESQPDLCKSRWTSSTNLCRSAGGFSNSRCWIGQALPTPWYVTLLSVLNKCSVRCSILDTRSCHWHRVIGEETTEAQVWLIKSLATVKTLRLGNSLSKTTTLPPGPWMKWLISFYSLILYHPKRNQALSPIITKFKSMACFYINGAGLRGVIGSSCWLIVWFDSHIQGNIRVVRGSSWSSRKLCRSHLKGFKKYAG